MRLRKARGAINFPEFPAAGPKFESILDPDGPDKCMFTDHLWENLGEAA